MVTKTALFERLVHGLYFYIFLPGFCGFCFFFALKITRILLIRYELGSEECATMPLDTDMQPCWSLTCISTAKAKHQL